MEMITENSCFGGRHRRYRHLSQTLHCPMIFAVYLPPVALKNQTSPVLYWLSGLTCTDENFMQKSGAMRMASVLGMILVAPDTSPRGDEVADADGYDSGQGAGFYVNATEPPWRENFQMYDYVMEELPQLISTYFPVTDQKAIAGHSMGGHGALIMALRNPLSFTSASAFSPICNPSVTPWGKKAFTSYLGDNLLHWQPYDATYLMSRVTDHIPLLIDQGLNDEFLKEQLHPEAFKNAAINSSSSLVVNYHAHYDHSYYFIASFIESHLRFHHKYLFS